MGSAIDPFRIYVRLYASDLFDLSTHLHTYNLLELGEANICPVIIDVAKQESVQACLKEVRLSSLVNLCVCVYR